METSIKLLQNKITISSRNVNSKKSSWGADEHQHHVISLTTSEGVISFDYWASKAQPYVRMATDLLECLSAFLSDAMYGEMSYEDFISEMGYEPNEESEQIHSECVVAYDKFLELELLDDMYDLTNELNEKYEF